MDLPPHFEVVERGSGLPARPREYFGPALSFGESGIGVVLVEQGAGAALRNAAELANPRETGGLIVGRRFRDSHGDYVAILNFVQTPPEDGSSGRMVMSARRISDLRATAAQSYPSMDVVGWWHSHSAPSQFSSIDFATQRLWTDSQHVGLLVFGSGRPWAIAYLGPTGNRLVPLKDLGVRLQNVDEDEIKALAVAGALLPRIDKRWRGWLKFRPRRGINGDLQKQSPTCPGGDATTNASKPPIAFVDRQTTVLRRVAATSLFIALIVTAVLVLLLIVAYRLFR